MNSTIRRILADLLENKIEIGDAASALENFIGTRADVEVLRDNLALETMKITLAAPDTNLSWTPEKLGRVCYSIADGMIKARGQNA